MSRTQTAYRSLLLGLLLLPLSPLQEGVVNQDAERVQQAFVYLADIDDDAITPVTVDYLARAIKEASTEGAAALIVRLDTPGGLMNSTRTIVKDFLSSDVPIIVYVAPNGARAASAGVFITMAAHVAAMAPASHIGAAHPVNIGGGSPGQPADGSEQQTSNEPSPMEEKVVNDAVAWVRSLADLRNRNADWAEKAVTESVSITSSEALGLNVIDLIADDVDQLLDEIDGKTVELETGDVTLVTAGAEIRSVEMWWGERVLSILSDPNLAFLLLLLGFYGLLFEFYSPGWGIGGTLGALCLVLAFFGLAVLPVNYAGLLLIFLGLGLFVAEAFFTSFGMLTVGGVVCLVLGGIMLIDSPIPVMRVSLSFLIPIAVATAAVAFFLITKGVGALRSKVQTGSEALIGKIAVAKENFSERGGRYEGRVLVVGEYWRARSDGPVNEEDEVRITDRHDLRLDVTPLSRPDNA